MMPPGAGRPDPAAVVDVVADFLADSGLEHQRIGGNRFVVVLPGTNKLRTTTSLAVEPQALVVNAFVARRPDEAHEAVYRWLLTRNARMNAVTFCLDSMGDIYLSGRVPLAAVGPDELDRVLGSVLEYADGSFNTILKLGFATAIRREYAWRISRGESTANLAAFAELTSGENPPSSAENPP